MTRSNPYGLRSYSSGRRGNGVDASVECVIEVGVAGSPVFEMDGESRASDLLNIERMVASADLWLGMTRAL